MTATFRISQGAGIGTYGRARRDITPFSVGGLVTLKAQDVHLTYLWEVLTKPFDAVSVLATPAADTTTLNTEAGGGYLIRLTVDATLPTEDVDVLYLGIGLDYSFCVLPASNETIQDNSQPPFHDGREGWWEKLERWLKWADTAIGISLPNVVWLDPVISVGLNAPPGGPGAGDRYVIGTVPVPGDWFGHAEDVATFDGVGWIFTAHGEGCTVWVLSTNIYYVYDGAAWVTLSATFQHNLLAGLDGGAVGEYFHLTTLQHTGLVGGAVTTLHKHTLDTTYDGGRTITADVGAVDISVPVAVNGTALALHQLMPAATANVVTIENLGASGASLELLGTRRLIQSSAADMTLGLTAADAAAYVLHITAVNSAGGTAGIGMVADDDVSVTSTAGKLTLHGFNVAGTGVEIEATNGGGAISIGCANLTNQIGVGGAGARNIYVGHAGAASLVMAALGGSNWTVDGAGATPGTALTIHSGASGTTAATLELLSGGDVGLTCVATSAGAQRLIISATNAGAGTAVLDIDAKSAITIDSAAEGFSIDGITTSNVCTTTGALTVDATAGKLYVGTGAGGSSVNFGHPARAMVVSADNYGLTASGVSGGLQIMLNANVAALRDLQIDAENANALGARITFSDSWQKDSAGVGGYSAAMPFGTTAAEWTTFKTNFGDGASLLNAINACGPATTTGWVSAENLDVDIGTETVDSFVTPVGGGLSGGCFWSYFAVDKDDHTQRVAGYICVDWYAGGTTVAVMRSNPAIVEPVFTVTAVDTGTGTNCTITLSATVTSDNWTVKVKRAPYMVEVAA